MFLIVITAMIIMILYIQGIQTISSVRRMMEDLARNLNCEWFDASKNMSMGECCPIAIFCILNPLGRSQMIVNMSESSAV